MRETFNRQLDIAAGPNVVWNTLLDVPTVASWVSIIGSAGEIVALKSYGAVLEDRVGPFRLRADIDIELEEIIEGRYIKVKARGEDRQVGSRISVNAEVELDESAAGTALRIAGSYEVTGRVASLGAATIRKKADRILSEFFGNAEKLSAEP